MGQVVNHSQNLVPPGAGQLQYSPYGSSRKRSSSPVKGLSQARRCNPPKDVPLSWRAAVLSPSHAHVPYILHPSQNANLQFLDLKHVSIKKHFVLPSKEHSKCWRFHSRPFASDSEVKPKETRTPNCSCTCFLSCARQGQLGSQSVSNPAWCCLSKKHLKLEGRLPACKITRQFTEHVMENFAPASSHMPECRRLHKRQRLSA